MRRWGIAEYLGFGLAVLVGSVGFLILVGVWIVTQRDMMLLSGSVEWVRWDRALSLWAYGMLLVLLGVSIGVGLWWWARIARPLLRIRDRLRHLLWEGSDQGRPLALLPSEAAEIWQAADDLSEAIEFIQQVIRHQRQSLSPIAAEWPPALGRLALQLTEVVTHTQRQANFREALLKEALSFIRLSQQSTSPEGYLSAAGPIFLRAVGASLGAFYRIEGDKLRRIYSYAYPTGSPEIFAMGEGWIGQVAREGRPLWLSVLPQGYLEALSALGKAPPQAVAVLPVIAGDSIRGVWDLAAFSEWDTFQQTAADILLPFFAVGYLFQEELERQKYLMQEQQKHESTLLMLKQTLQEQEERLRSSSEIQEHLQRQLMDAESARQRVERFLSLAQNRWEIVVAHLREAIVFFDTTGRPRYLSPGVQRLLGYSESELQIFFRPVDKSDAEAVRAYFQSLLSAEGSTHTIRFRYFHKDGHLLWIEAVGCNYLSTPGIEAILLILRDITEEVEYEKQYRTRLKFQSLVENSPDIIFRTDRDGRFLYVNPTIERYTGYSPNHYIRNTIYSVGFSLEEVRFWEEFIHKLFDTLQVQSAEIGFPSVYGMRRMAVRGIPEVGPGGEVETMVVLLQDITELRQVQEQLHLQNLRLEHARKVLEEQKRELEEKNRDIMESIAYARRIQGALLIGEAGVQALFPESFVLHWLRDVVGGDFYWCGEVEGQRIVAVVDCTGHGVPGAFMTFLGYTLLESAVHERKLTDPALILQYMDTRLRQLLSGQEAMQDGMDVALCSIDPQRRLLRFAGAHRPLLLYQSGRWSLVPGAPTGLGGALWLDEVKSFTTHAFSYQSGDAVYLYTDGYLDQFSADGQRRFSHRRFRELLMTWVHLPMAEQHQKLLEELRGWMGDKPPTDDITVLGLRL
ncbi:MAG: PAS domain S-box protein [Bacteroidia bacterium]|nr:PAS domain S-box protein [Bacteroidia bacterium]MDW8015838.1 PAS domain S-box protein [Bacteroidia bacterium]